MSILEKINLLCIGLSSYQFKNHVASDIVEDGFFLSPENLETQVTLDKLTQWTKENQMLLNKKKSKTMNFNFTNDYQFSSRLRLDGEVLETISETRLLGVLVNDSLTWDLNTKSLVKRANARMRILHKLVEFSVPVDDLITIYIMYIRSILEQSCQVWHSSLTFDNLTDLERVQKNALRIILKEDYISYKNALEQVSLESLVERRENLCLTFAKNVLKQKKLPICFH